MLKGRGELGDVGGNVFIQQLCAGQVEVCGRKIGYANEQHTQHCNQCENENNDPSEYAELPCFHTERL